VSRIVVALGGNALAQRGEPISAEVQRTNAARAAAALAPLAAEHELVLTHGNGPQVGMLLLETESDANVPPYPLDVLGAETEGMIGYLLEQALRAAIPDREFATLLTQTVVDADDPAFDAPSKPVGPMYDVEQGHRIALERGFMVRPDGDGVRRVVASPEPQRLLEERAIHVLLDSGIVPICAGGGGIPVVEIEGRVAGVEAVVDKDLTAVVLARAVGASTLLLLTDVDGVYEDFGTLSAFRLERLSPAQARSMVALGDARAGSMAPKLHAAARFADGGGVAVIGALDQAADALVGRSGTRVSATGRTEEP
jgi:carbamate kinase